MPELNELQKEAYKILLDNRSFFSDPFINQTEFKNFYFEPGLKPEVDNFNEKFISVLLPVYLSKRKKNNEGKYPDFKDFITECYRANEFGGEFDFFIRNESICKFIVGCKENPVLLIYRLKGTRFDKKNLSKLYLKRYQIILILLIHMKINLLNIL